MIQSIILDIEILTAIRRACDLLSRSTLFLAISAARKQRGEVPPNSLKAAFQGHRAHVDMVIVEIELTDKYDPDTGTVWIDTDGHYKINILEHLK